ncbi:MAG: extracellular solute-binding protein [Pirellulales bacterium]|nr:extracellular solute-binding protein [Pirellulales bacterium]
MSRITPLRNVSFFMLFCWALPVALVLMVAMLMEITRPPQQAQVVVYTALDEEFSQPIFDEFTRKTGIVVLAKFDTESTKTVGLTQALFAERDRPRCDLFWNNEIVNTLRLDQAGILSRYATDAARGFPSQYRSTTESWYGFAARARVILVNTDLVPEESWPSSILDLTDSTWRGRVGLAKPLAGTTASHAACLFAVWGEKRAQEFFHAVKANARIMSGNKQVALAVAAGELAFGLTDTDDAMVELDNGRSVAIVYPDQAKEQLGTLFIPNTIALIEGAPRRESAEQLIDFLLSPTVERLLAAGPSAQIPLNPEVGYQPRVESPHTIRAMAVDFEAAARHWNTAAEFLRQEFATAN